MKLDRYVPVIILFIIMSIFVIGYGAGRIDQKMRSKENIVLTFSFMDSGWYTVCERHDK